MADAPVKLADISKFFGYERLADFSKDWKQLSDTDKQQLKAAITDGSMTY